MVRVLFNFFFAGLINIPIIETFVEIIYQFTDRSPRLPTKLDIFLIMITPKPFGDVVGNGKFCPTHLVFEHIAPSVRALKIFDIAQVTTTKTLQFRHAVLGPG
jgi:hypothetical protein